jgi:hypothetical protein
MITLHIKNKETLSQAVRRAQTNAELNNKIVILSTYDASCLVYPYVDNFNKIITFITKQSSINIAVKDIDNEIKKLEDMLAKRLQSNPT